jgi:hypothetical protein
MVYKKIQNKAGDYKDVNEVRYDVLEAHEAWNPQGKNVGWDELPSKEAAVASYGLTYDPLPEVPNE